MRGVKPKPTAIRELSGRIHRKKVEHPDLGAFEDDDLTEDIFEKLSPAPLGRAKRTLDLLRKRGIINGVDSEAFARYCQHLHMAYKALEIIRREGILTEDPRGGMRKHPAMQIHRDNSLAALRYEEQFGLTPSARARLTSQDQIAEDREVAEFEDFLADK